MPKALMDRHLIIVDYFVNRGKLLSSYLKEGELHSDLHA